MISQQPIQPATSESSSPTLLAAASVLPPIAADLQIIFKLKNSRFPVYFAYSKAHNKKVVMKVFPFFNGSPCINFRSESAISNLSHQNLLPILDSQPSTQTFNHKPTDPFSYVLMDLAPYGNFCDLLLLNKLPRQDKVIRTFFKQLIEGLDFLHGKGIAHMDLKLENLLLGEDFQLKIIDFDTCHQITEKIVLGRGTRNYRALELKKGENINPWAADIYSAGIILFALKAGTLPYIEEKLIKGFDLFDILTNDPESFWKVYEQVQETKVEFEQSFKELFSAMVDVEPEKRPSIQEIKSSEWFNGPVYSKKEMSLIMSVKLKAASALSNSQTKK